MKKGKAVSIRPVTPLPEGLDKRLAAYTLSAAATTIAVMALAQPLEAAIAYTPTNQMLSYLALPYFQQSMSIDLNHDGIPDFQLMVSGTAVLDGELGNLSVSALSGGGIMGANGSVAVLPAGARIGPGDNFTGGARMAHAFYLHYVPGQTTTVGNWANANGYLGLRFDFGGETHYGWARLAVTTSATAHTVVMNAQLTGYAYETSPGNAIVAGQEISPEPPSLALLALGALGLLVWRKRNALANSAIPGRQSTT